MATPETPTNQYPLEPAGIPHFIPARPIDQERIAELEDHRIAFLELKVFGKSPSR